MDGKSSRKAPDLLCLFMFHFFSTPDKRRTMTSWKIPGKKKGRKKAETTRNETKIE